VPHLEEKGTKMKIKILDREFNDKSFWMMFDTPSALDYFIPTNQRWVDQGIKFTLEDTNNVNKYMRHIEIWAEGDEKVLDLMLLSGVV
jgi:hypothetical protein